MRYQSPVRPTSLRWAERMRGGAHATDPRQRRHHLQAEVEALSRLLEEIRKVAIRALRPDDEGRFRGETRIEAQVHQRQMNVGRAILGTARWPSRRVPERLVVFLAHTVPE